MDTTQQAQMLTWLDEELRRERSQVVDLRQRVESQSVEITDQSKRIQELEARLAGTQAKLSRFNVLEQAIQTVRDELVAMVENQRIEVDKHQREQVKNRHLEQESISRAMNEFKRSLEVVPPLQEKLTILRAEDQRLGEAVLNLQNRFIGQERKTAQLPDRISYVEGQRAQDVKAVSTMQTEVIELLRRTEGTAARLQLVEDIARKTEQGVNAVASFRDDITRRQQQALEEMRLKESQRERVITEWRAEMGRYEEEMGKQRKRLEQFARQQDESLQVLVAIEEYKQVLNREQKQVTELQRMSEERQRREVEEWVAANEQRWTKFRLEREAQWNQQVARNEVVEGRLKKHDEADSAAVERIQKIQRELVVIQEEYRAKLQELWQFQERFAVFQLDGVRKWYDEAHAVVAERYEK